jgi:hypothetical protein
MPSRMRCEDFRRSNAGLFAMTAAALSSMIFASISL